MNTPLVSICCVTYNHAQFIRKCLDGFLMQQTDFPIEILIHDDCSTDGTTEIIREYEAKYLDLIFPLYEEENQYQQGKAAEIDFYNYRRARGKYIAYCEGDDYWTDPLKLQKQVDFMEANPEYSVCFHDFDEYNAATGQVHKSINQKRNLIFDIDISTNIILKNGTIGLPLTMMFRVSYFKFSWRECYNYYRDTHEIYHLLKVGKGKLLAFTGGVYNIHSGGISSSLTIKKRAKTTLDIVYDLYKKNQEDDDLRNVLCEVLLWSHDVLAKNEYFKISIKYFFLIPSLFIKTRFIIFKRFIKKNYKKS